MRAILIALSLLLIPATASAKKAGLELGDATFTETNGLLVAAWDCAESRIDGRGKDHGVIGCLRGLAINPWTGRSSLIAELVIDSKDRIDRDGLKLTLKLDAGKVDRNLDDWTPVVAHSGEIELGTPELGLEEWLQPTDGLVRGKPDDERLHVTVAWNFQTWDPSVALRHLHIQAKGQGVGGKLRWNLPGDGMAWTGDWDARPDSVWDDAFAERSGSCTVWRIKNSNSGKASDALSDGANKLPLAMRFEVLSKADDGEFEVGFPDHKFTVGFSGGKLRVRGMEDFTLPLGDLWRVGDVPNDLELVYDGTFVTVAINGEVFGPMAGRRKTGKRFRWEFEFEDSKNEVRNLVVAPCTLEDPEDWKAPEKEIAVAEEQRVQRVETDRARVATARGTTTSKRYTGKAKVVWAIIERDGVVVNELRIKRKKSALEIMQGAAAVGSGLAATGQAMGQFGQDVKTNLDAAESGDYSKMKSSDTQVSYGPCGATVNRAEASVTNIDTNTGSMQMEMKGTQTNYGMGSGGCPDASMLAGPGHDSSRVATVILVGKQTADVTIGGEPVGVVNAGSRTIVQLAPGTHDIALDGAVAGEIDAKKGKTITVDIGG